MYQIFKREIFYLLEVSWCVDALYRMYKESYYGVQSVGVYSNLIISHMEAELCLLSSSVMSHYLVTTVNKTEWLHKHSFLDINIHMRIMSNNLKKKHQANAAGDF